MVLLIVVGGCSPVAQSPGANSSTDVAATALTTAGPTVSSATGTDSRQATVKSERPATSSTAPPPPTPEESALGRMSLRQKAAQVLLVSFSGTEWSPATERLLQEGPPGGLLLLGSNVSGAAQLTTLTGALQQRATARDPSVGLFIAVDQEGGSVLRVREGVPHLPSARAMGDASTVAEARRLAVETATGLLAQGVNMNLAPVADVVADKGSFLYTRSYSTDTGVAADYVTAVADAFVRSGLVSVVKHFPGHGSASGDTHAKTVVSDLSQTDFERIHLPPFRAAIEMGVQGVMLAHVVAKAYDAERPASSSERVIEGLLRNDLGFSGLAVCDDISMAAVAGSGGDDPVASQDPGRAAVRALRAGCDLLIATGTLEQHLSTIDAIVRAVESGDLPLNRLDQAVLRILRIKTQCGLLSFQGAAADGDKKDISKMGDIEFTRP